MSNSPMELAQTVGVELELAATMSAPDAAVPGLSSAVTTTENERFTLGREIGRGGMGRVLEATDRQFRRTVAVKEMLGGGPAARRRFLTEALVTGNLEHPGIPAVYERGDRADGSAYYAMRLVSGRTLAAALEETRSLEERLRLLPAVVKVAETVAYAHDRGVVHRDLKPENVLLGRHGEVVLLDWGIAKVRGLVSTDGGTDAGAAAEATKTQVGTVMGSPMYMAPEQARGDTEAIDERTDVFALGAMLYHVLTGRPPYDGRTVKEIADKAIAAQPQDPAALAPTVNPELAGICARAMSKEQGARHGSALELAAALEAFQSHAATQRPSRAMTGMQNAALASVVLMAVLLLGLGLTGVYVLVFVIGGALSLFAVFALLVSLALAAVEWHTRGSSKLVGVGLALVPVTLAVVTSQVLMGMIHTSEALAAPGFSSDVPKFLTVAARSAGEMSWGPFATVPLALVQIILWALVARRNSLLATNGR